MGLNRSLRGRKNLKILNPESADLSACESVLSLSLVSLSFSFRLLSALFHFRFPKGVLRFRFRFVFTSCRTGGEAPLIPPGASQGGPGGAVSRKDPRGSWGRLGASWSRLGASWNRLGVSWGRLGASPRETIRKTTHFHSENAPPTLKEQARTAGRARFLKNRVLKLTSLFALMLVPFCLHFPHS